MDRINQAEKKFLEKYACSQAIVTTYCDQFGLDIKNALNISAGFAGGMRSGKTCGAITGAIMILGLAFSGQHSEQLVDRKDVYAVVSEFTQRFKEKYGSTECKDLLTVDISTAEGKQVANEKNLFYTICPKFIRTSAEILESLIKLS